MARGVGDDVTVHAARRYERGRPCPVPRILTRRDLCRSFTALSLAYWVPSIGALGGSAARRRPVVGFHADAPWLDPTGRDLPYRPPAGFGTQMPDCESLLRLGHFL